MKMNSRKLFEATLAAGAFAFAGSVAAEDFGPAKSGEPIDPAPAGVAPEPVTTAPVHVALNEPRPVVIDPTLALVSPYRDRWDIPYKDLVFERELSRTDGAPQGDDLNPLVNNRSARYHGRYYSRY